MWLCGADSASQQFGTWSCVSQACKLHPVHAYVLTILLCCALCCCVLQLAVLQTVSGSEAQASSSIPTDEVLAAAVSFPPGSVSRMEENIKAALNSDTKSISMLRTLKLYLERMGTDKQQVGRVATSTQGRAAKCTGALCWAWRSGSLLRDMTSCNRRARVCCQELG